MEKKTEAENLTLQQKTKELHVRYLERECKRKHMAGRIIIQKFTSCKIPQCYKAR